MATQSTTVYLGGGLVRDDTVMVVEDDPDVAGVLADVLTDAGYAVTTTGTAVGAVALVRRLRPCAVVLDLGLPYRSGVALLEELKADRTTAAVPVVVVSGHVELLPPERAGLAAAVLPKPFEYRDLLDAVRAAHG